MTLTQYSEAVEGSPMRTLEEGQVVEEQLHCHHLFLLLFITRLFDNIISFYITLQESQNMISAVKYKTISNIYLDHINSHTTK